MELGECSNSRKFSSEMCGLQMRQSADPDTQNFLQLRTDADLVLWWVYFFPNKSSKKRSDVCWYVHSKVVLEPVKCKLL